ncbi:MAG TPA: hypothetical protein VGA27_00970 [Candidatus Binatia bacterium]
MAVQIDVTGDHRLQRRRAGVDLHDLGANVVFLEQIAFLNDPHRRGRSAAGVGDAKFVLGAYEKWQQRNE